MGHEWFKKLGVRCPQGEGYDYCMSLVVVGCGIVGWWGRGMAAMRHDRKEVTAIVIVMIRTMMMAVPLSPVHPLLRESLDWCSFLLHE